MTLVITRAFGLITVQDLGRPGHMHEALPPGGALVPSLLLAANRAAHNPSSSAAIEICGLLSVRAESPTLIATDASPSPRQLHPGESLTLPSEPRRAVYLALRGGIVAPILLGSRAAHLSAGLGRLLRAGDRLSPGTDPVVAASAPSPPPPIAAPSSSEVTPIRILAGPDPSAFEPDALAILTSAPYRILPASDRVGTRLTGPVIPRLASYLEQSRPMVRGALEVPRDGAPIVLGPEHPTTGGYPLLAVLAHADLDRFFSIRLGGTVLFTLSATSA